MGSGLFFASFCLGPCFGGGRAAEGRGWEGRGDEEGRLDGGRQQFWAGMFSGGAAVRGRYKG